MAAGREAVAVAGAVGSSKLTVQERKPENCFTLPFSNVPGTSGRRSANS